MNAYYERQQNKIDYYRKKAESFDALAKKANDNAEAIHEHIPFGQPILVGHHSEKRHRKDLARARKYWDDSSELRKKAEKYRRRAENVESSRIVYSDDPGAIENVQARLDQRLDDHALLISVNSIWRKKISDHDKKNELMELGLREEVSERIIAEERKPIPSYSLTNSRARINTDKKRLASLKRMNELPLLEEQIGDIHVKYDGEDKRIRIFFPEKPSEEWRQFLGRQSAYKWSNFNGCWQRKLTIGADVHYRITMREVLTRYPKSPAGETE